MVPFASKLMIFFRTVESFALWTFVKFDIVVILIRKRQIRGKILNFRESANIIGDIFSSPVILARLSIAGVASYSLTPRLFSLENRAGEIPVLYNNFLDLVYTGWPLSSGTTLNAPVWIQVVFIAKKRLPNWIRLKYDLKLLYINYISINF